MCLSEKNRTEQSKDLKKTKKIRAHGSISFRKLMTSIIEKKLNGATPLAFLIADCQFPDKSRRPGSLSYQIVICNYCVVDKIFCCFCVFTTTEAQRIFSGPFLTQFEILTLVPNGYDIFWRGYDSSIKHWLRLHPPPPHPQLQSEDGSRGSTGFEQRIVYSFM